jgi:hypothetical protein
VTSFDTYLVEAGRSGEVPCVEESTMLPQGQRRPRTGREFETRGAGESSRDPLDEVMEGMEPMDAFLRSSGHYGPRVAVRDDADTQTRLIAFVGRNPEPRS